jgi:spore coat polysaccharide biosynthesis protein SpsF (cytidylyltransferase family)
LNIPIFISVRIDSSRLPAKCLLEILPGETTLSFVIKRGFSFGFKPIVCTDEFSYCNGLRDTIETTGSEFFIGSKNNKLKRWFGAAKKFGISKFHSVDADDPFFCCEQVKNSFYLNNISGSLVNPSNYSDSGGATEGYTIFSDDLKFANSLNDEEDTSFIKPFLSHLNQITLNNPYYTSKQTRLTLDYLEDYIYLRKLACRFGFEVSRKILESNIIAENLFDNVHLNDVWKKRQLLEGDNNYHGKN